MVIKKREDLRADRKYLTSFAREMRKEPTEAEKLLWSRLRARQLSGLKFKRQFPIGEYIADFVCAEHALVVELDGGVHEGQQDYDDARQRFISAQGFRVIRFRNAEITSNLRSVEDKILAALPRPR